MGCLGASMCPLGRLGGILGSWPWPLALALSPGSWPLVLGCLRCSEGSNAACRSHLCLQKEKRLSYADVDQIWVKLASKRFTNIGASIKLNSVFTIWHFLRFLARLTCYPVITLRRRQLCSDNMTCRACPKSRKSQKVCLIYK